jgi:DNA repair protein RadC
MIYQVLSDRELVTELIGAKATERLYKRSLSQLIIDAHRDTKHCGKLLAAVELTRRMLREKIDAEVTLANPTAVRDYLRLTFTGKEHEVFMVIYLDAQHRVLGAEELFRGTLTQTSVYPREVVKHALRHNSAAVIFAHNHPSGVSEPSRADEALTSALKQALGLVDVRVLDHFVVGIDSVMSFAERGLL